MQIGTSVCTVPNDPLHLRIPDAFVCYTKAALTDYMSDPIFSILKNMSVWQIHNYTMRNSISLPKLRYLYKRIKE